MIAHDLAHGLIHRRPFLNAQTRLAEQPVHRLGVFGREKFPFRVRPRVLRRTRDIHRSRRDQRHQQMRVHRQRRHVLVVALVIRAEPMRETRVDALHRFAEPAPRNRRAALARIIRDHAREPLVTRTRPQRRLAHARVPHHHHILRVDVLVRLEIIQRPAQAPRPRRHRAPVIRRELRPARLLQKITAHAVPPALGIIRLNVRARDRRQRIAARQQRLHRPAPHAFVPRALRRAHPLRTLLLAVPHPLLRDRDPRIARHRVIALEVHPDKRRHRSARAVRHVEQQVHQCRVRPRPEPHRDLLARRLAAQRVFVRRGHHELQLRRPRRTPPVLLRLEQPHHLRPPLRPPRLHIRHLRPAHQCQRIGQRVGANLRFIVVEPRRLP